MGSHNQAIHDSRLCLALTLAVLSTSAPAYEINEQFSIGGVLAPAIQCQDVSDAADTGNTCELAGTNAPLTLMKTAVLLLPWALSTLPTISMETPMPMTNIHSS